MAKQPDSRAYVSNLYDFLVEENAMGNVSREQFFKEMQDKESAKRMYDFMQQRELVTKGSSFETFYRPFESLYASEKKKEFSPESGTGLQVAPESDQPVVMDGFPMERETMQVPQAVSEAARARPQIEAAPEQQAPMPPPQQQPAPTPFVTPEPQAQAPMPTPILPKAKEEYARQQREAAQFGFPTNEPLAPQQFGQVQSDFPIKSANKAIAELEESRRERLAGQRQKPGEAPEKEIAPEKAEGFFAGTRVGQFLSEGAKLAGAETKKIIAGAKNLPELFANTAEDLSVDFATRDLEQQFKDGKISKEEFDRQKQVAREMAKASLSMKAPGALPTMRQIEYVMDNFLDADEAEDFARKNMEEVRKSVTNADKGFDNLVKEGRYADAVQYAATNGIGSLPYAIAAMIPYVGTPLVAGVATQDKYRQIQDMGVEMGAKEIANAYITGAVEGITERVSAGILKGAGRMVAKMGREAAQQTIGQAIRQVTKRTLGSTIEEAISEGLAQFSENIIDKVTIDPERDLLQGVAEAVATGAISGGGITATAGGAGLGARLILGRPAGGGDGGGGTPVSAPPTEPTTPPIDLGTPPTATTTPPTPPTGEQAPAPVSPFVEQRANEIASTLPTGEVTPEQAAKAVDDYLDSLMTVDETTGERSLPTPGTEQANIYDAVTIARQDIENQIVSQSKQAQDATQEVEQVQPKDGEPEYPGTQGVENQAPTEADTGDRPVSGGMQPGTEEEGQVAPPIQPPVEPVQPPTPPPVEPTPAPTAPVEPTAPTPEKIAEDEAETQNILRGQGEQRRSVGRYIKDGIEYVRNLIDQGVKGNSGEIRFTDSVSVPFTYKIVEAETLQPSHQKGILNPLHFIWEAQPKPRTDQNSIMKEREFAENPRFGELGEQPSAYSGAPVVNARNEVIQGNNRSAGLRIGYEEGRTQYRDELMANAAKFGISPEQLAGFKNPVLVREVNVDDKTAIELGNYDVKDLESGGKVSLNPIAIANRLSFNEISRITNVLFGEGYSEREEVVDKKTGEKTITERVVPLNIRIRKTFKQISPIFGLRPEQIASITRDGELTAKGAEDLARVVQHFLYKGGDMTLPEFFESMPYMAQEGIRKAMPAIFSVPLDKSLITEIQDAILAYNDFETSGAGKFDSWLNQINMFAGGKTPSQIYDPTVLAIAKIFAEAKTQREISDAFLQYANLVNDRPATLVEPEYKGISKQEAINQVFNEQKATKKEAGKRGDSKAAEPTKQEPTAPTTPAAKPTKPTSRTPKPPKPAKGDVGKQPTKKGPIGTVDNPGTYKAFGILYKAVGTVENSKLEILNWLRDGISQYSSATMENALNVRTRVEQVLDKIVSLQKVADRLGVRIGVINYDPATKFAAVYSPYGTSEFVGDVMVNAVRAKPNSIAHELAHAAIAKAGRYYESIDFTADLATIKAAIAKAEKKAASDMKAFADRLKGVLKQAPDLQGLVEQVEKFAERYPDVNERPEEFIVELASLLDEGLRGKILDNSTIAKIERAVNELLAKILGKGVLEVRFTDTTDVVNFFNAMSRGVTDGDLKSLDEALELYESGRVTDPRPTIYWKKTEIPNGPAYVKKLIKAIGDVETFAATKGVEGIVNDILAKTFGAGKYIVKFATKLDAQKFLESLSATATFNGREVKIAKNVMADMMIAINEYLKGVGGGKKGAKPVDISDVDMTADEKVDANKFNESFPPESGTPPDVPTFEKFSISEPQSQAIDFVFAKNPALLSIGTKQQYAKYLDQFYPDSKFKDIVYHGSLRELKEIDKRFYVTYWTTSLDYLNSSPFWGNNQVAAIVNTKTPMYSDKPLADVDPELASEFTAPRYTPDQYDSVIGVDAGQERFGGKTIAVKNNFADTHILGTQKDLDLFRDFVKKQKKSKLGIFSKFFSNESLLFSALEEAYDESIQTYEPLFATVTVPDAANQDNLAGLADVQKARVLHERTNALPNIAALQVAVSESPQALYSLYENVMQKVRTLQNGVIEKTDAAKAIFAAAFQGKMVNAEAMMDPLRVLDPVFDASHNGAYMYSGQDAAAILLNSDAGQQFLQDLSEGRRSPAFEQQAQSVLNVFGLDAATFFDNVYAAQQAFGTAKDPMQGIMAAEKTLQSKDSLLASALGLGQATKAEAKAMEALLPLGVPIRVQSTGNDRLDSRADAMAMALGMDRGLARLVLRQLAGKHIDSPMADNAVTDAIDLTDATFYDQLAMMTDMRDIAEMGAMFSLLPSSKYSDRSWYDSAKKYVHSELAIGTPDKDIVAALKGMYSGGLNDFDYKDFFAEVAGRPYRSANTDMEDGSAAVFAFLRSLARLKFGDAKMQLPAIKKFARDTAYDIDYDFGNDLAPVRKIQRDLEKKGGFLFDASKAGYQKMQLYMSAAAFEMQKFSDRYVGKKKTMTQDGFKDSFISRLTRSKVGSVNEFNHFLVAMHKPEREARRVDIQERLIERMYNVIMGDVLPAGTTPTPLFATEWADMLVEMENAVNAITDPKAKKMAAYKLGRFKKETDNLQLAYDAKSNADMYFADYLASKGIANPGSVTPAQAKAMPEFADHAVFMSEFKSMQQEYLDILLNTGQINQERYDHLTNGTSTESGVVWENYVPLVYDEFAFRDELGYPITNGEKKANFFIRGITRVGKKLPLIRQMYKKPELTATDIEKPTEVLFHRMITAIRSKHRNDAIKSTAAMLLETNDPKYRVLSSRMSSAKDRYGNVSFTDLISERVKRQTVTFYEGGKKKYLFFADPNDRIMAKMKAGQEAPSGFEQIMRHVNNMSRGLFTFLRPSFIVNSLIRDVQEAFVNIQVEGNTYSTQSIAPGGTNYKQFKKKLIKSYVKNYGTSFKFLTAPMFKKDPKMVAYYEELQRMGGLMSWSFDSMQMVADQINNVKENIDYAERYANGRTTLEKGRKFLSNVFVESVHNVSNATETVARLATYSAMRDLGIDPVIAATAAKNVTVNFEKKGAARSVRTANMLWLFLNPSIQGIRKTGKQLATPEGRKALMAYAVITGAARGLLLNSPALAGFFGGEEEEEKVKSNLETYLYSKYVGETKVMFPNPLDPDNPLLLPKPYGGFRVSAALGEGAADLIAGVRTRADVTDNFLSQIKGAIDPIAGTASYVNQWTSVLPMPILHPVVESMANIDHNGRMILFDQGGSFDYLKANRSTSNLARDIARGVFKHTPGHMDISPTSLEHVFESYIDLGPAQIIKNSAKVVNEFFEAKDKPTAERVKDLAVETAFINRVFYNDNISEDDRNDLYNYLSMSKEPLGRWNEEKVKYAQRAIFLAREKGLVNERVLQASLDDLISQITLGGKLTQKVPGQNLTWLDWYSAMADPEGNIGEERLMEKVYKMYEEAGSPKQE